MSTEIIVKENTLLDYAIVCTKTHNQHTIDLSFYLERYAILRLELFVAHTDASITINCQLSGESSNASIKGMYISHKANNIKINTMQHHQARHTTSNVIIKGVLYDNAHSFYTGMIHVEKNAHKTHASQENKNIVLSDNARAVSIPQIEVLTKDVQCFHASATGKFDQEQLFYAYSRAITPDNAETLLLKGFFADIFESNEMKTYMEHYL